MTQREKKGEEDKEKPHDHKSLHVFRGDTRQPGVQLFHRPFATHTLTTDIVSPFSLRRTLFLFRTGRVASRGA